MNFSFVPLPRISHLFYALFNRGYSDKIISESWRRETDKGFLVSKTAISLSIIVKARQNELNQKNITVWVPDYFCNVSLEYVRACGVILVFYPIKENLQPDINWCYTNSKKCNADLFIHTHYFGNSNPIEQSAKFCKNLGAWLIEDAAHVFQPQEGVGMMGDFVLYSPHKFLAIPSGAIFIFRNTGINKLSTKVFDSCVHIKNTIVYSNILSHRDELIWCVKRVLQKVRLAPKPIIASFKEDILSNSSQIRPIKFGNIARYLFSKELKMLDEVGERRKEAQYIWNSYFKNKSHKKFELCNIPTTPYLLPIKFDNKIDAEEAYSQFARKGIPVQSWPDLPPEIISENHFHSDAIILRYKIFYLPVHQSLDIIMLKNCMKINH